jgi:hypothetical protein
MMDQSGDIPSRRTRVWKQVDSVRNCLKLTLVLLGVVPLFGGQSLQLAGNSVANGSLPSYSHSLPSRVEFYLHDWVLSGNTLTVANTDAIGFRSYLYNPGLNNLQLSLSSSWETDPVGICQVQLGTANGGTGLPTPAIFVRYQHDPTGVLGAPKSDYCEMWDTNGNRIAFTSTTWTTDNFTTAGTSLTVGGGNDSRAMAFFRIHTTLVPPNSRMPLVSDNTNTLLHWKFDGDLTDASGNGHNGQLSNGNAVYVNTPYQSVISVVQTANSPSWNNWVTLKAGETNQLSGTSSFSQSDAGGSVTCLWTQVSGPTTVVLANSNSCSPTVAGLVFGDYVFQLRVTDSSGDVSTSTQEIGAVAMDDNGVVINADPNADLIFGPMIAFGRNPWGLQDSLSKTMVDAQYTYQGCCTPPMWATSGQGTVSYTFCGIGGCSNGTGTKLDTAMSATSLSVDVDNVSILDLSTLPAIPTTIFVDAEVLLICGTTGSSGHQTLTVCYDGRGVQGGGLYATAAVAHAAGANVGQFKIAGSSTLFTSDPKTALCPSGSGSTLPAPMGRVIYSTGSVTMTPGSSTMAGVGTSWTNGNGVYGPNGMVVRVAGTYAGGTPFAFIATVTGLTDPTHITLSRNYPSDADAGTFPYVIVAYRYASVNYTRADGSTGRNLQNALQVCIGDLQMGGMPGHDYAGIDSTLMTGQNYSYKDTLGMAGAYNPNFYGTGLAARAFYLRSGYKKALDLANFIDDYWIRDPEIDSGYAGAQPLLMGGGVIGAFADLALNPATLLTASDMRGFLYADEQLITIGCDADDTRNTGYERAMTALGAIFDTNSSFRAKWTTDLEAIYDQHDVGGKACKQEDNSFSNAYLIDANPPTNPPTPNAGYAPLIVTTGSAIATDATGNGITPDRCNIAASGTLTVTKGSAVATDSAGNFIDPNKANNGRRLIIHGTMNGAPYVTFFSYQFTSSNSVMLNGLWPGDSGSFTYVIESTGYPTTIGASQADHASLQQMWACIWNSASQITLDRPWTGPSGTVNLYQSPGRPAGGYAIGGYGQQPYMLGGMAVLSLNYAAQVNDPNYQTKWLTLAQAAATYMWNPPSYDPNTQGIQYGVGYAGCDQKTPVNSGSGYINGTSQGNGDWCQSDLTPQGGISVARGLAVEALNSLTVYYLSNPTPAMKAFGDTVYGSIWASSAYTTGGVYTAPDNIQASNCYPTNLAYYKWPGFCFGIGMSHQWPAVRVGGVQGAQNEQALVEYDLAAAPSAEKVEIVIIKPSGAKTTYPCAASPCRVMVDKRQGTHVVQLNYLSASGKLIHSKHQILESRPSRRAIWTGLHEPK